MFYETIIYYSRRKWCPTLLNRLQSVRTSRRVSGVLLLSMVYMTKLLVRHDP